MTTNNEEKYGVNSVDFVCIGAQKSGTTFVTSAFRSHPEIQLPKSKELYFFSTKGEYKMEGESAQCNADRDIEWYKQQFATSTRRNGEISTHYILDPNSAERIKEAFPDIKVFSILRNPVDRAFSQYNMERYKTCKETRSLMRLIKEEPDNEIIARGLYARQLAPYKQQFSDDQLRIYLFDEMVTDPPTFFLDLFDFIGVDTSFVPPGMNKRMNKSGKTKYVFIPRFVRFVRRTLEKIGLRRLVRAMIEIGVAKQYLKFHGRYNRISVDYELPPDERAALYDCFAEDIEQLENLLNRDLSHWKSPR